MRYRAGGSRGFRDCRTAYVQAIKAANEQRLRRFSRARGAGGFCRALEYRLCRHQIRAPQCRAADLSRDPDGSGGLVDGVIVWVLRPQWPNWTGVGHSVVAGTLVHGFYLGGTAIAIAHSIPVGLSALIPGLQPILTSTLASSWLGERVTPLQWSGLLLGLAGVVLILHDRPMSGEAGWGWLASGVSLVSITLGMLYQRRYCGRIDWRAGNLVQYIAVTIFFAAGAWLFESNVVHWTSEFVLALAWLAVVLSIGSIGLLYWLLRRSAATSVASLFYLVPAVTAAMCHVLFGRRRASAAPGGSGRFAPPG